jgi:methionyl-tRNA formyltransferase
MLPTTEPKGKFLALKKIVLIGGGDLMAASAKIFNKLNFDIIVIAAPRHINEQLILTDESLMQVCQQLSITPHIFNDINQLSEPELSVIIPDTAIAICFGPAWIFSEQIIHKFHHGMFNINAIPVPHYLGGAHYTWQLLNNNRDGGCFFQQITNKIDQGSIFAKHHFSISNQANTPHDYFVENVQQGEVFIQRLSKMFINEVPFSPIPYETFNENRIYLPRLRTDKQAYINWQWQAKDIVSFCQGFADPYIGAATLINGQVIRLNKLKLIKLYHENANNDEEIPTMHPFCHGIIIKKTTNSIIVAANNGFIELIEVLDAQELCMKTRLKEGMRLYTPSAILDEAMTYQVKIDGQGFKG